MTSWIRAGLIQYGCLCWYVGWEIRARRKVRRRASGRDLSPHHVKVSLTIGMATSLIKRVALKRPLTHSAYMMLKEGWQKSEKTEDKER